MTQRDFERNDGARSPIDICHGCAALWLDRWEELTLTPGSVLQLFVIMNGSPVGQRNPLGSNLACPSCRARPVLTRDVQRATPFEYWRCPAEHGRFITFFQFLREKNFVRPPDAAEVDRLRQNGGAPPRRTSGSASRVPLGDLRSGPIRPRAHSRS